MLLPQLLAEQFEPLLAEYVPDRETLREYLQLIKPATNAQHGDFQANFCMPIAKKIGRKAPELATEIVAKLPAGGCIARAQAAGPGFINITLDDTFLAESVAKLLTDDRLGITLAAKPKTIIIDYSGPNVAKPLHVGHLRSTIIGDAIARIMRFMGHTVIGDNHLGDWGTQFGILLYGYKHHLDATAYAADPVRELARLYVYVRSLFQKKSDDDDDATPSVDPILQACRSETAKLHAGDAENVALWHQFMPACLEMLRPIYDRLDVSIEHALGESFYNPMLPGVVDELLAKGIAVESQGAVVVPNAKGIIPRTTDELQAEEPPALIRKRDGAFTYTTTDLATIQYRVQRWNPNEILYVVDARQALHFRTLFANATRWGYDQVTFVHPSFGSILGPDRKPLRTRDGGVPELADLLADAVKLGREKYEASLAERKSHGQEVPDLSETAIANIAEVVGIGAVKYSDLSQNRTMDYIFDYNKMLATEGNTATYMQYAYARCWNIFRKGEIDPAAFRLSSPKIVLREPQERAVALQLLKFPEALAMAVAEYRPHHLAVYLWDLAKSASIMYDACPVLKADDATRNSRLALVDLVGRSIGLTLNLLGIKTLERM